MARELEELLPDAAVEAVGGHDWTHDPFSAGTWAAYPPGTWLRWAPELGRTEGRIAFAGSDIAPGWGVHGRRDRDRVPRGREVEAILS